MKFRRMPPATDRPGSASGCHFDERVRWRIGISQRGCDPRDFTLIAAGGAVSDLLLVCATPEEEGQLKAAGFRMKRSADFSGLQRGERPPSSGNRDEGAEIRASLDPDPSEPAFVQGIMNRVIHKGPKHVIVDGKVTAAEDYDVMPSRYYTHFPRPTAPQIERFLYWLEIKARQTTKSAMRASEKGWGLAAAALEMQEIAIEVVRNQFIKVLEENGRVAFEE